MGLFDKLKKSIQKRIFGMNPKLLPAPVSEKLKLEIKAQKDLTRTEIWLHDAEVKFEEVSANHSPDEPIYIQTLDELEFRRIKLEETIASQKFLRPDFKEDLEYRETMPDIFLQKLEALTPPDSEIRYHGTPIYNAERILQEKQLVTARRRHPGLLRNVGEVDEISVTKASGVFLSMGFYSGIAPSYDGLPAGCLFVLQPKPSDLAANKHDIIKEIDFSKNPEQFLGIISSPENQERLQSWVKTAGLNPDLVYTLDSYIEMMEEKSKATSDPSTEQSFDERYAVDQSTIVLQTVDLNVGKQQPSVQKGFEKEDPDDFSL